MSNKESVPMIITEENNKEVTLQIMKLRVAGKTYKEIESEIGLSVDEMKKTTYNAIAFKIQPGILNETIKPEALDTDAFWAKYGIEKKFGMELLTGIPMDLKKAVKLSELIGRKTAVMKEITTQKATPKAKPETAATAKTAQPEVKNFQEQLLTGSAADLTKLMCELIAADDEGGSSSMWANRAERLMSSLMGALVELRDKGEIKLELSTIRERMVLGDFIDLSKNSSISEAARAALSNYLNSIPSFDLSKGKKQSDTVKDQHGYLQMQFAKELQRLNESSQQTQQATADSKADAQVEVSTEPVVNNQTDQPAPTSPAAWMKDINGELHYVYKGPSGILSLNYANIKSVLLGRNVADPENPKWAIQITTIAEKRSSQAGLIDVSDVYLISFDTFEEAFSFYPIHIPEGALVVKSEIGRKMFYTNVGEGMIATLNYSLIKSAAVSLQEDKWMLKLTAQPELRVNDTGAIVEVSEVFNIGYNNKEAAEAAFPFV